MLLFAMAFVFPAIQYDEVILKKDCLHVTREKSNFSLIECHIHLQVIILTREAEHCTISRQTLSSIFQCYAAGDT